MCRMFCLFAFYCYFCGIFVKTALHYSNQKLQIHYFMTLRRYLLAAAATAMAAAAWAADVLRPDVAFTPTAEEAALFTFINSNHDGVTWGRTEDTKTNKQWVFSSTEQDPAASAYASTELPHNDWLIFPAIQFDSSTTLYELKFDACRGTFSSYYGLEEKFEVKLGTAPTAQAMTLDLMDVKTILKDENKDGKFKPFSEVFSVPAPGVYYIGIHYISSDKKSIGIYVANMEVNAQQSSTAAPAAVDNLAATPGLGGALSATLVFYFPTRDAAGNLLPADTQIRAVAASGVDTKEVTGAPGSVGVITDLGTVQGYNDITVTTYIGEESGKTATVNIYTGVSVPGPVTAIKCDPSDDDMTLHFNWEPPVRAANGGFVSPTGNTYTVYLEQMNNIMGMDTYYWDRYAELPVDQCYFDYQIPADGKQRKVKIAVTCSNVAGVDNSIMTVCEALGGRPYELPMIEDFKHCSLTDFTYNPIINYEIDSDYVGQTFTVNDPYIIDPKYNNDSHTPAMIFSNHIGTRTRVGLPKFTTEGLTSPAATLKVWMGSVTPKMSLYAQTVGTGWIKVADIDIDAAAEAYRTVTVPLGEQFADKPWVHVAIDTENHPDNYEIAFVAAYSFTNSLAKDLGIKDLMGKSPVVGEPEYYTATVYNPGQEAMTISSMKWSFVRPDGTLVAEKDQALRNATLQPAETRDFYYTFEATPEQLGAAELVIAIAAEGDLDAANNERRIPVIIKSGGKVMINDLRATAVGPAVELSWTAPCGAYKYEGFEAEEAFVSQPATIAGFTNIDGDGYQVWNFGERDPLGGYPQAFNVWSTKELTETFGLPYKGYKGDRYIMARCPGDELDIPPMADDWLISPEVNGGTYVSFYARPVSALYGNETVELMYSSTTADREAFAVLETLTLVPDEVLVEGSAYETTLRWERYSTDLPADARYFAIHYCSHDIFGIMLDELDYSAVGADNVITGYNIFRDDALIAENVPATDSYVDTTPDGDHTYYVRPCIAGDCGGLSNKATASASGVGAITVDAEAPVEYYNLQGIRVASPEPGQMVIRRQGTTATKVYVK